MSLQTLLQTPSATTYLLSIQKLCEDNHVFIEFHPSIFYVKDMFSRSTILQDVSKDKLYKIKRQALRECLMKSAQGSPPHSPLHSFFSSSLIDWHSWLGHPSFDTIYMFLRNGGLSLPKKNKDLEVCKDCEE